MYLTETWKKATDSGYKVGVIFVDFKKAFDTVDPAILKSKLSDVGVSGVFCLNRSLTVRQDHEDQERCNSIQFYLPYTKYYVHKVRLILQYYLTKIEEEGKNKFDNMLL